MNVQCLGRQPWKWEIMSASGKFVLGVFLAVFVTALFAVKPVPADGVPVGLDSSVRILGLLVGLWIATSWMQPFVVGRLAQRRT